MKKLLAGLLVLGSLTVFAEDCVKSSSLGITVCAEVVESNQGLVIKNISPDIQKKKSVAVDLCESFGEELSDYKVKIVTAKSCYYYSTKGFFGGDMVQACNDLGGLTRGRVFSKIKCILE